jgi:hypothetical protein
MSLKFTAVSSSIIVLLHYCINLRNNNAVCSESRCTLGLRYVDFVVSIEAHLMS